MHGTVDILLPLEQSEDEDARRKAVARSLGCPPQSIRATRLLKHSIDARARRIKIQLRIEYAVDEDLPPEAEIMADYPPVPANAPRVLIVGCGPAGMFAALQCIELGCRPILLERGKDASARRFDLAPLLRRGEVIEDSNYCFGEGGAGTFSDGKLYTRATKRGPVRKVYETLVAHGAPTRILVDAHPHIGSNLLPNVVKAIRASILKAGGEVHFQTRVNGLLMKGSTLQGAVSADGKEWPAEAVILATGHSARDVYRLLSDEGVLLEQKPFAVGVRIEHPQGLIDSLQYHLPRGGKRHRLLPAAAYRLATKIDGRGVHSFCMCPGGWIVPAATENDEVVVNGMSLSKRDSAYANSGMVVTVEPQDTASFREENGVLAGIAYQKALEQKASTLGGGRQKAPAQRLTDFLNKRVSADLPGCSYHPGITAADLNDALPPAVASRLRSGLQGFGRSMRGYVTAEACLVGFETRTSSPVRIPRDEALLQHPQLSGLYPCGEGAGFAGGIVSAALDGMRCAEAACHQVHP